MSLGGGRVLYRRVMQGVRKGELGVARPSWEYLAAGAGKEGVDLMVWFNGMA